MTPDVQENSPLFLYLFLAIFLLATLLHFYRKRRANHYGKAFFYYPGLTDGVSITAIQGRRAYMEDTFVSFTDLLGDGKFSTFGVFDGHGGSSCSEFCRQALPQYLREALSNRGNATASTHARTALLEAFELTDRRYLELCSLSGSQDGSTAAVALIDCTPEVNTLSVANAGDSRVVLCHKGGAVDMSVDHKPNRPDEKQRIEEAGGHVVFWGTWRVEGVLALTRAIGDRPLKQFVCSMPEIMQRPLVFGDEFLIIASDGLWDVMDSQEAVDFVRSNSVTKGKASFNLVERAYSLGSSDNITCLVVDLSFVFP